MASLLDEIIDGSTDDSVSTSNLLRTVLTVATRIGAPDLRDWATKELKGYGYDDELPQYRMITTPVLGLFTGPMQHTVTTQLPPHPEMMEHFSSDLRQPLTELAALTRLDEDPRTAWPAWTVAEYENKEFYGIQYHELFSASKVVSRQALESVVESARTTAMELALDLQTDFPDAGTIEGPSIQKDTSIAPVIYNITNNIYGDEAQVATGSAISQQALTQGDRASFEAQLAALGLTTDQVKELADTLDEEQSLDKPKAKRFFKKLGTGALKVAGNVSTAVVTAAVTQYSKMYLGLS